MNTSTSILLSFLWLIACSFISWYIIGKGMSARQQLKIGLRAIFVSFIIGISMLFVMIAIF